jgi:hypothetical protein
MIVMGIAKDFDQHFSFVDGPQIEERPLCRALNLWGNSPSRVWNSDGEVVAIPRVPMIFQINRVSIRARSE